MRLIDADALRKKSQWMEMPDHQGINFDVRAVSVSSIDIAQTIDAVPVVRCEKCLHWDNSQYANRTIGLCNLVRRRRGVSDFCSYGERKEG